MPTGYTAGIEDGSIPDFKTYALQCMRAFGVCANLRDEPLSSEIPEVEVSPYHKNALEKSIKDLEAFNNLTDEELLVEFNKYCELEKQFYIEELDRNKKIKDRYAAFLADAKKFVPPTADHENYKKFMIDQIVSSMTYITDDYYERRLNDIETLNYDDWKNAKYQTILNSIEYHSKKLQEDIDKTEKANEWISAAKQALENQESNIG